MKRLSLVIALAALLALTQWGYAADRQNWENWTSHKVGERIGTVTARGGATATTPGITVSPTGGKKSAIFYFDFGGIPEGVKLPYWCVLEHLPRELGGVLEAENAKLVGCSKCEYRPGYFGVGNFGKLGDSITFENVPPGKGFLLWYSNGSGSTNQCSLYFNGKNVGKLQFTDTGYWVDSPYATMQYVQYVGDVYSEVPLDGVAQIKLQIDADDLAANNGRLCCNPDRIEIDRPDAADIELPCRRLNIDKQMGYLSVAVRAPRDTEYSIGLVDGTTEYRSVSMIHWNQDDWEYVTLPFDAFSPKIEPAAARIAFDRLRIHLRGPSKLTGRFYVGETAFTADWPSKPPEGCPFKKSKDIEGISFTGRHQEYESADTWYPSWASDGNCYCGYTDGIAGGIFAQSHHPAEKATTGNAKMIGDDPMNLKMECLPLSMASALPYESRYPAGGFAYNGVWYYGTYVLDANGGETGNWTFQGPLVGYRYSKDYGKTWTETSCSPDKPLFGETGKDAAKVKMGAPHFVDFGKNMEHSPDGKAYLTGHGATRPDAGDTWISGDQIYIARVTPSPENINDASKWEFFAGNDRGGNPVWSGKFADIKPLYEWNDHAGCVTMTYNAPLEKYLMCVSSPGTREPLCNIGKFDTYILESDRITGPWRLVTYWRNFGEQGYFVNIPTKFISPDGKTMWICYAANFNGLKAALPVASRYGMCWREIRLR